MNRKTVLILGVGVLAICLLAVWQLTPRVIAVEPDGLELHGRQPVTILFSRPMDPASVESLITLTPSLAGKITWNEEAVQLTYLPEANWPADQSVILEISSGARSQLRLPLLGDFQATLQISPYLLIYLWPAEGSSNLYLANPITGESRALTNLEAGILDYTVHPNGLSVIYSFSTAHGTSSVAALELASGLSSILVECEEGVCLSPSISRDGSLLAYEFISQNRGTAPGIRVFDPQAQTQINPGDPGDYLEKPLWGSSGWLVFYNQTQRGFQFWNPKTSQTRFLPNDTGGDGSWSADGRYFICSEIQFTSETLAPRHLLLYDTKEETTLDLSRGNFLEDLNPSLSPFGLSVAFSRKSLDPQSWSPGRQLWVMDIGTGQNQQLTDEVDYHHTSFAWHPDGDQLAFVRYNQAALSDPPEIWLINRDGSGGLRLIINGFAPAWVP
jgi:Tol biopolymer transport system component